MCSVQGVERRNAAVRTQTTYVQCSGSGGAQRYIHEQKKCTLVWLVHNQSLRVTYVGGGCVLAHPQRAEKSRHTPDRTPIPTTSRSSSFTAGIFLICMICEKARVVGWEPYYLSTLYIAHFPVLLNGGKSTVVPFYGFRDVLRTAVRQKNGTPR